MKISDAISRSGLPRSEAEILLAALLQKDRSRIIAHPEGEMTAEQEQIFAEWTGRRMKHEPISYITGVKEFHGRPFHVDRRVLIPRPSTEILIDEALRFLEKPGDRVTEADEGIVIVSHVLRKTEAVRTIIDVGTGSGCIAITLALECPDLSVIATDISAEALEVAKKNARLHHVEQRIEFAEGRGLDPVRNLEHPFLLVSNPPYIPAGKKLDPDVQDFEPHQALFAGNDGKAVLETLVEEAKADAHCAGIILECETEQAQTLPLP